MKNAITALGALALIVIAFIFAPSCNRAISVSAMPFLPPICLQP